jgi:hypothetical protein
VRLTLSSSAAPESTLGDLLETCQRRGFAGLELDVPSGQSGTEGAVESVRRRAEGAGVRITALRMDLAGATEETSLGAALSLGAPVVVPLVAEVEARALAERYAAAGARLAFIVRTNPDAARIVRRIADAVGPDSIGLGWDIRPERDESSAIPEMLAAAGSRLQYVRLYGGGPETETQTGLGVGALIARLAIARFQGPLVLTPSDDRYHRAWSSWLGRRSGWGCGKTADPDLVTLDS